MLPALIAVLMDVITATFVTVTRPCAQSATMPLS